MAMSMSTVETIARLAHVHVDGIVHYGHTGSHPFKIGLWNWRLSMYKNPWRVKLYPENCPTLKDQLPIASFTVRILQGSGHEPLTCSVNDRVLTSGDGFVWTVNLTSTKFLVEVEFHDLKVAAVNEGDKLCLSWSSEEHIQTQAQAGIARGLHRMLDKGLHTDVTIITSSGSVGAHRAVLASRSPVFDSMFHHNLTEKQLSTVHIQDMTLESCRALLFYLYGNLEHEEFRKHRTALVHASHKYDIPDLKDACEESLLEDIDVRNVLARLKDSLLYQLGRLKCDCLRYLLEFGKIDELQEEFNEFLHDLDKDLVIEIVRVQQNLLKTMASGNGVVMGWTNVAK